MPEATNPLRERLAQKLAEKGVSPSRGSGCTLTRSTEPTLRSSGQFHSSSYLSSGAVGDGKGVTGSPHIGHWI